MPFNWKPLFADPLTNYQQWNRHEVNVRTRFLHFIVPDPGTLVPEVQIYGKAVGPPAQAPVIKTSAVKPRLLPTMDALIGTNAFVVWCPTSDDTRVASFALPLESARSATLVTLQNGQTNGVATPMKVENGAVTLEASEKPAIVLGF